MRFSKHTIFSQIRNSEKFFIINALTGNADILSKEEASKIHLLKQNIDISNSSFVDELIQKGYILDEKEETKLFQTKYLEFLDNRESDEIQLFLVPNYSCNFACTYCYQDQYSNATKEMSRDMIDAFFAYVKNEFRTRKKYVTVFGGEPLLNSPKQRELIAYLVQQTNQTQLDLCFVTNGYTLAEYIDILKTGRIREIQVTLDGTEAIHNARRFLKGGNGTFAHVVNGIDACIRNGITVNLRMVIDKENIDNLPDLARYAIDKGWTQSPFFKTQVGRNYELHHCQSAPNKLFSRITLYEKLYELVAQHPHILEFYKPAYSLSKFLSENGSLPEPLFDSCPACKTEWAFDYSGHIFPCTATVGKATESLGTFYPEVKRNQHIIDDWENRDVTSIHECKDCSLQLACGGGCGSVAKNKNNTICSTDCRPVKELLELGFSAYFDNPS